MIIVPHRGGGKVTSVLFSLLHPHENGQHTRCDATTVLYLGNRRGPGEGDEATSNSSFVRLAESSCQRWQIHLKHYFKRLVPQP